MDTVDDRQVTARFDHDHQISIRLEGREIVISRVTAERLWKELERAVQASKDEQRFE